MEDTIQCSLLDCGSGSIKVGLSSSAKPQYVIPTKIVQQESKSANENQQELQNMDYSIQHGQIKNFESMRKLWDHCFYDHLKIQPSEHPLILSEISLNPKNNRQQLTTIMFEEYCVPKFYLSQRAVFSMVATGAFNGVSFQSGYGVSVIAPICSAQSLPHATIVNKFGGKDVTEALRENLSQKYSYFKDHPREGTKIATEIKQKHCLIAQDIKEAQNHKQIDFNLPDGTKISISNQAPELMFDFKKFGIESQHIGVHEDIYKSILKCGVDIQPSLFNNIVLSGGNTMFTGIAKRMEKQIQTLLPPESSIKIIDKPQRNFQSFTGSKVVADLMQQQMWIDKNEYEERGPTIIHSKCA